jgi:hypothetical protein
MGKSQYLVFLSQPRGTWDRVRAQEVELVPHRPPDALAFCDAELCGLSLQIEEAGWSYVGGWTGQGGSKLGTKRYGAFKNMLSHHLNIPLKCGHQSIRSRPASTSTVTVWSGSSTLKLTVASDVTNTLFSSSGNSSLDWNKRMGEGGFKSRNCK